MKRSVLLAALLFIATSTANASNLCNTVYELANTIKAAKIAEVPKNEVVVSILKNNIATPAATEITITMIELIYDKGIEPNQLYSICLETPSIKPKSKERVNF